MKTCPAFFLNISTRTEIVNRFTGFSPKIDDFMSSLFLAKIKEVDTSPIYSETPIMENMKSNLVVLLSGGFSEERSVSIDSAAAIRSALEANGFNVRVLDPQDFPQPGAFRHLIARLREINPSFVFIGLHGGAGENGQLQALLELEGIPFTGSDSTSSALCMDKWRSTLLVAAVGLPVPKTAVIRENHRWLMYRPGIDIDEATMVQEIGLPMVIKPNHSGSSVGVTIVQSREALSPAITEAARYSTDVLAQQFIPGRELTVAILNDEPLPPVEIKPHEGFYDYANKYSKGKTEYIAPAPLTPEETQTVSDFGRRIFLLHGCRGYGRVDFRYDGSGFYFLEVNTLPGMTALSLTPKAASVVGISFEKLINEIMNTLPTNTPTNDQEE
jgi:D-alanine-D-alanine ligase